MTAVYIVLTLKFKKDNKRWTAYCEELGTASYGRSLTEADKRIKEAVKLHIQTLEDVGERQRFFKENGIKFYTTRPTQGIDMCIPFDDTFVQPHVQAVPALAAA